MKITLFVPCYVDQMAPQVAIATTKLLRRLGHEVVYPEQQTCCGQPAFNTGYWDEAADIAQRQAQIFDQAQADAVVCPSGSCGAMQRVFYPTLLKDTALQDTATELASKTYELAQFLVQVLKLSDVGAYFSGSAVLHKSCHALRELNCRTEASTLLQHVEGLDLRPLEHDEECCGFGGTFAVKQPAISTAMGDIKVGCIQQANAEWVISGDTSCLFHIGGLLEKKKLRPKPIHLAEVLASTRDN